MELQLNGHIWNQASMGGVYRLATHGATSRSQQGNLRFCRPEFANIMVQKVKDASAMNPEHLKNPNCVI